MVLKWKDEVYDDDPNTNIVYEKIKKENVNKHVEKKERYYTPKEIGSFPEIVKLFSYLKSPAHKVGKLLKDYKFKQTKQTGVKKYLLSKQLVKNIIDLYFSSELIQLNNTNNTKYKEQHQNTPNNKEEGSYTGLGSFRGVRVITPLYNSENKKVLQDIKLECLENEQK